MSDQDEIKNVILNEEEQSLLLSHNYDGIEEFDYPLPNWWKMVFIITTVFGIFYVYYYEVAGGPSLKEEFAMEMKVINAAKAEYAKDANNFELSAYTKMKDNDPQNLNGFAVYDENCLSCHEEKGKGDIGPNLTDDHWLNIKDLSPETIYKFVMTGNEDNGMPAWGETLSKEELYQVVAYVLSLKNTNVADGKEPQGKRL